MFSCVSQSVVVEESIKDYLIQIDLFHFDTAKAKL